LKLTFIRNTIFLVISLLVTSAVAIKGRDQVEGEFLIKMKGKPNASKSQAFVGNASGKLQLKATYGQLGLHFMKIRPGQKVEQVLSELKANPDIEYVEPNYILRLVDHSGLERLSLDEGASYMAQSWSSSSYNQTGNSQVKVTEAWNARSVNQNSIPIVAVIDSGVDYNHPVFNNWNAIWKNPFEFNGITGFDDDTNGYSDDVLGWNFVDGNNNPMDSDAPDIRSHGTHVAGIVLGVNHPMTGSGQARVKIMSLKFLGSGGGGSTAAAIQAIYYAVRNGARVINMSWGGGSYSQALHDALAYAYNQGVVLVAAAGNSSLNNDTNEMYPANFPIPSQLTVGAVNDWDSLATFSNFGQNRVQITAPGVSVYSTAVGGYRILSGTSMAAPFVSGLAAMIMSERPDLSGYQIRNLLLNSADSLSNLFDKIQQGARAQALNSILNAQMNIQAQGYQPSYEAVRPSSLRAPASEPEPVKMGGCGMVSSSIMSRWIAGGPNGGIGSDSHQPSVAWIVALSLLPIIIWQGLRVRSRLADFASRRRHERFIMNSEIKVKVGDRELIGQMNTISAGGLSFKADTLLEKGGTVTLQISSPDGQENLEVQGRIVWSEENQAYGVQFDEEKTQIASWSKQLPKAS